MIAFSGGEARSRSTTVMRMCVFMYLEIKIIVQLYKNDSDLLKFLLAVHSQVVTVKLLMDRNASWIVTIFVHLKGNRFFVHQHC